MHKNECINKLDLKTVLLQVFVLSVENIMSHLKKQVFSMDPDVICDFKLTNCLIACLKISMFIII